MPAREAAGAKAVNVSNSANGKKVFWMFLVLLSLLAFLVKGFHDERVALHFRDFKQPYASARCLLHGCDPYSEAQTRAQFLAAGGADTDAVVFQAYSALYPPPSLLALAPIAALRYPLAHAVWFALTGLLFCIAALLIADLCGTGGFDTGASTVVLAAFVATSTILLMLGQISGFVIALLGIGLWCLLRRRFFWLAVLCLTAALLLKPHDVLLLVFCYLPFAGRHSRRASIAVFVLAAAFTLTSLVWFAHGAATAHWRTELQANLAGNGGAGDVNDPVLANREAANIANLQALFGTVSADHTVLNLAAVAVCGGLLALWGWPMLKMRDSPSRQLLGLAAVACLTLLPIYHRQYDTRLLLLTFPAIALLLRRRRAWGFAGLLLMTVATLVTWHKFLNVVIQHAQRAASLQPAQAILLYRPLPEIELVLACFFVGALWAEWRDEQARGDLPQAL